MAEKIASALGGSSFSRAEKKQGYYGIKANGHDYAVTWGYGHLCTLSDAKGYDESYKSWRKMPMPFIPDEFKIVLNDRTGIPVRQTYSIVKKLFSKADYIINATDFDREGELIFYYLYSYMGCRKPVMRMKLSSTTQTGIHDAFNSLIDNDEVVPIRQSAQCRSIADWVVGCNMTAAMTIKAGGKDILSIGRVQTPTLAIIVRRDDEIARFRPEDYYTADAVFTTKKGETYKGTHKNKRFDKKEDADAIVRKCDGRTGTATMIEDTEKTRFVPNLYSLDSLQMDANGRYGFSLKKTLDVTQSLYDKGFVTYPRTDCQYLPEDMRGNILKIHEMLKGCGYDSFFTPDASVRNMDLHKKRFFDDTKLGSHYAIIPTDRPPAAMTEDEKKIFGLVAASVARMLYKDAVLVNRKVTTEVEGEQFISSGTSVKEKGWMAVDHTEKEEFLPDISEGDAVSASISVSSKKTEPPKHYTEKTLLAAMIAAGKNLEEDDLKKFMSENKLDGLGTVATRAGIIETVIRRGYAERSGKNILSTEKGRDLIRIIPVEDIKSAALTAQYEKKLNLIVKKQQDPDSFLSEIYESTKKWCGEIDRLSKEEAEKMAGPDKEETSGMTCPVCGKPMHKFSWGWGCTGYKEGCKFSISQEYLGKKLTDRQAKTLCEKGEVGPMVGFTSKKTGNKFEASLKIEYEKDQDGNKVGKIRFKFPERKDESEGKPEVYAVCPDCGASIKKAGWGWVCPKCGLGVPYEKSGRKISKDEAEALFSHGWTKYLEGFKSTKGKPFTAALHLEDKRVKFVFQNDA